MTGGVKPFCCHHSCSLKVKNSSGQRWKVYCSSSPVIHRLPPSTGLPGEQGVGEYIHFKPKYKNSSDTQSELQVFTEKMNECSLILVTASGLAEYLCESQGHQSSQEETSLHKTRAYRLCMSSEQNLQTAWP